MTNQIKTDATLKKQMDSARKGQLTLTKPTDADTMLSARLKAFAGNAGNAFGNLPPLALLAQPNPEFDLTSDEVLCGRSVLLTPIVNPLLHAVLVKLGASPTGSRSYYLPDTATNDQALEAIIEAIHPATLRATSDLDRMKKGRSVKSLSQVTDYRSLESLYDLLTKTKAGRVAWSTSGRSRYYRSDELYQRLSVRSNYYYTYGANAMPEALFEMAVLISAQKGKIHFKFCTDRHNGKDGLRFFEGAPNLHLYDYETRREPISVTPAEAMLIMQAGQAKGWPVYSDPSGNLEVLFERVRNSIAFTRQPGAPGKARVVIGGKAAAKTKQYAGKKPKLALNAPDFISNNYYYSKNRPTMLLEQVWTEDAPINEKLANFAFDKRTKVSRVIDEHVVDILQMRAVKTTKRNGIRPYQNEAIALHLSTKVGYLNACAPGLGKTVMTLVAAKEKALVEADWTGLVVVPAAVRSQWSREAAKFFPEASVLQISGSKKIADTLKDHMDKARADKKPALVIASYETMRLCKEELLKYEWHDLICDEAVVLKSPGAARTKALWELRAKSRVAIALTGTPIEKGLDDMARILAWVRHDENLFYGSDKLSKRFNPTKPKDAKALWEALGPTVFRRDRSEIADELPDVSTETVILDPNPAEKALADGARRELKKIYDDLLIRIETARKLQPGSKKLAEAQRELKKARGAVLGGVTLARMAASDPACIEASTSAGAQLLKSAGLVAPATKKVGTKREQIVSLTNDLVERGEAVLIFTDFSSVCDNLVADFKKLGVKAEAFKGGMAEKVRDKNITDYQAGKIDVLVLTGAAREGLNLQRTTVLVHYDLPWLPTQVVQRVGRAARFGAGKKKLSVLIPIMAGTIEERVAAVLIPRAMIALAALDTSRGKTGSDTELGVSLSGLTTAVSKDEQGDEGLFKMAEKILV